MLRNVYCGTYFTHVQTCNVTRVQSATECILWYTLYTCRNLQQPTTLEASLRHPWSSLRAMKASSPLQAPFKHPSRWSPLLQAPLKPPSSFLQAEGFKPPSSPLEAPLKMKPPVSCFYSFGEPLTDGLTQCLCIDRTLLYSWSMPQTCVFWQRLAQDLALATSQRKRALADLRCW